MNIVSVATKVPGLSFKMIEVPHRLGNYRVAVYATSNADHAAVARDIIGAAGTGKAWAVLCKDLREQDSVRHYGNPKDLADFVGRDNLPKNWDKQEGPLVAGALVVCRWQERISPAGFEGERQPLVASWYDHKILAMSVGVYLLSDEQWTHAATGGDSKREYATKDGKLIGPDGKVQAHCSVQARQDRTIDVDNPKNSVTPEGIVGMTGNVWEATEKNPTEQWKHGLRGGSLRDDVSVYLRVLCRVDFNPVDRGHDIGSRFGAPAA